MSGNWEVGLLSSSKLLKENVLLLSPPLSRGGLWSCGGPTKSMQARRFSFERDIVKDTADAVAWLSHWVDARGIRN